MASRLSERVYSNVEHKARQEASSENTASPLTSPQIVVAELMKMVPVSRDSTVLNNSHGQSPKLGSGDRLSPQRSEQPDPSYSTSTGVQSDLEKSEVTSTSVEKPEDHSVDHQAIQVQLIEAQKQTERFRNDFFKLNQERQREQLELSRLIEELRTQLDTVTRQARTQSIGSLEDGRYRHMRKRICQLTEENVSQAKLIEDLNVRLKQAELNSERSRGLQPRLQDLVHRLKQTNGIPKSCENTNDPISLVIYLDTLIQTYRNHGEIQQLKIKELSDQLSDRTKQLEKVRSSAGSSERNQINLNSTQSDAIQKLLQQSRSIKYDLVELRSMIREEVQQKRNAFYHVEQMLNRLTNRDKLAVSNSNETYDLRQMLSEKDTESRHLRTERDRSRSQCSVLQAKLDAAEAHIAELQTASEQQLNEHRALETKSIELRHEKAKAESTMKILLNGFREIEQAFMKNVPFECDENYRFNKTDADVTAKEVRIWIEQVKEELANHQREQEKAVQHLHDQLAETRRETSRLFNQIHSMELRGDELQAELQRVSMERDYYLQIMNEQGEELVSIKADYKHQLRKTDDLNRTRARLDELTEQIRLLRRIPVGDDCRKDSTSHENTRSVRVPSDKKLADCSACCTSRKSVRSSGDISGFNHQTANAVDENHNAQHVIGCKETKLLRAGETNYAADANRVTNKIENVKQSLKDAVDVLHSPIENGSTIPKNDDSHTLVRLQQRLSQLEKDMSRAMNEKSELKHRGDQLAQLLVQMTEQNQRLIKELEERSNTSCATENSSPATPSSIRGKFTNRARYPHANRRIKATEAITDQIAERSNPSDDVDSSISGSPSKLQVKFATKPETKHETQQEANHTTESSDQTGTENPNSCRKPSLAKLKLDGLNGAVNQMVTLTSFDGSTGDRAQRIYERTANGMKTKEYTRSVHKTSPIGLHVITQ